MIQRAELETMAPVSVRASGLLVEVLVNERGEPVDYRIVHQEGGMPISLEEMSEIGRFVLSSRFAPARSFGKPRVDRVLIYFSRSHIDVLG